MKKYNLEKQLAQKFNGRTITPSADAWERVSYNRQQQGHKRKKNRAGWYMVAAILVIALGSFTLLFRTEEKPQIQIVEQKSEKDQINGKEDLQPFQIAKEAVSVIQKPETITYSTTIPYETITQITKPETTEVVFTEPELQKANEVANAIAEIAEKNGKVTEDEIELLLLNAQKEIAIERIKNNNQATNDTALLKEAESEVENSFREKTLGIAKLKYSTIKIAFKQ